MSEILDVVIIGAGVAGLAAATRLAEAGVAPVVLEAAKMPGGRARSWTDPVTGDVVDNGQHLLMGCYRETLRFLERVGTRDRVEFQERLRVCFADAEGEGGAIDCPPLPGSLALLAGLAFYRGMSLEDRAGLQRVLRDVREHSGGGPGGSEPGGSEPGGSEPGGSEPGGGEPGGSEPGGGAAFLSGVQESPMPRARPEDRSGPHQPVGDPRAGTNAPGGSGSSQPTRLSPEPDESAQAYLQRLDQSERARRNFWDPLIYATLNERPEIASARTLRRVLALGLLQGPESARLGWSRVGLGDLYTRAAESYLHARGGALRTSAMVQSVIPRNDRVEILLRAGETMFAQRVVAAVPPAVFQRLLPRLAGSAEMKGIEGLRTSPIVGVNLWFDRPVLEELFVGLLGTTMHWVFNKGELLAAREGSLEAGGDPSAFAGPREQRRTPGRATGSSREGSYLALVASGARDEVERSAATLIATALADLGGVFPWTRRARLVHALVVKEREATTSPAVGWDALRPGTRTPEARLFLAGDWTATGLPATIESAALSGHLAAEAVMEAS